MMRVWWCFAVFVTVIAAGRAFAHETLPCRLDLEQLSAGRYALTWHTPYAAGFSSQVGVQIPDDWEIVGNMSQWPMYDSVVVRGVIEPGESGIDGCTLEFPGLAASMSEVIVHVKRLDGSTFTAVVPPTRAEITLRGERPWHESGAEYVTLGVHHILLGIDHLLFVLGLLLIVDNRWMLLKTITAFTLAHSITLAIATLGYASAPLLPLNAAIALSILFLGPEVVRHWRGETSFTIRHPWVVAFAFGLLHGFGFASGLTTAAMPTAEIPLALLAFNVGVELGQVAFVALMVLLERSFRVLEIRWPRWVEVTPGYLVGGLGAFWTIQRTAMLIGGL
jgi:hypothetical protein